MQIRKRDMRISDFDISRVISAIEKAMQETVDGVDKKLSKRISDAITKEIESNPDVVDVESIQDLVEEKLMASNRKDVARKYILYRELRNQNRVNRESFTLLDDEFVSKYKKIKPPMNPLGEFVFYRTYSRWIPEEKRREYWWETCRRAVEFNCKIIPNTTKEEAQKLYDNLFNLRQFLAGRTLFTGNTKSSFENNASQFNCSFAVIDNFNIYKDICYLLMLGVGVGFSVEHKYVSQLPKVRGNVNLMHKPYFSLSKHKRKEVTDFEVSGDVVQINVGDSKNGWSSAIDLFLKVFYSSDFKTINTIIMNYDSVRPFGEILKTFGGKASGHDALLKIIDKTYNILTKNNTKGKRITSLEAMDIANIIAEGIVVGGVRRSAQLGLFDRNDTEVMGAKSNLYTQDEDGIWSANQDIIHRMMSNNSVAYYEKPSLDELKERFETIKHSAEGNFFNMANAIKRNLHAKGTNP
jgi:adenosylcobalamin-dependent ribonucleoside-triphosphate reductase